MDREPQPSPFNFRHSAELGGCIGLGVAMGHLIGDAIFEKTNTTWWPPIVGGLICITIAVTAYQSLQAWKRRR